jgi:hypothetical protein
MHGPYNIKKQKVINKEGIIKSTVKKERRAKVKK